MEQRCVTCGLPFEVASWSASPRVRCAQCDVATVRSIGAQLMRTALRHARLIQADMERMACFAGATEPRCVPSSESESEAPGQSSSPKSSSAPSG